MTRVSDAGISLGFTVPDGDPVRLPLRHIVITGQTQQAGKTTALEGLITRSERRAITFITKRGEGSFAAARAIPPYFREQAGWQYVAAVLEASRGEKLRMERAWIIRASKGARTLADVQRNVRAALVPVKGRAPSGFSADMYLVLDAYLDVVVPEIARTRFAPSVDLAPGVNAMDLTRITPEMQHLVIRSTIEWVHQHARDVVVVVPEAWKFIPEGRGTPVKLAAEAFIREGAGLGNYLWLDSQDIAGVEKAILKQCPVWVLGVQREANEIARTLAQIPAGVKRPKPEQIATLGLGQFFACWGEHVVKVYAQPAWLDADRARAVARGEIDARALRDDVYLRAKATAEEPLVTDQEARELREENDRLKGQIAELEKRLSAAPERPASPPPPPGQPSPSRRLDRPLPAPRLAEVLGDRPLGVMSDQEPFPIEPLYGQIKAWLLADPEVEAALLRIQQKRPELVVEVTRETVMVDGTTSVGRVAQLIAEGFFDKAQKGNAAYVLLRQRGFAGAAARIYEALTALTAKGFLVNLDDGYRAVPGMKVNVVER